MQKIAIPSRKELYDLYFKEGLTRDELCKRYGCCRPVIGRWLKNYGLNNIMKTELVTQKRKKTNLERYGYEHGKRPKKVHEKEEF